MNDRSGGWELHGPHLYLTSDVDRSRHPPPTVSCRPNLQPDRAGGGRSDVIRHVHSKTAHVTTMHLVQERQTDVPGEFDRRSRQPEIQFGN